MYIYSRGRYAFIILIFCRETCRLQSYSIFYSNIPYRMWTIIIILVVL